MTVNINFGEKLLDLANLLIIGSIIGPIWFESFKGAIAILMLLTGAGIWAVVYFGHHRED